MSPYLTSPEELVLNYSSYGARGIVLIPLASRINIFASTALLNDIINTKFIVNNVVDEYTLTSLIPIYGVGLEIFLFNKKSSITGSLELGSTNFERKDSNETFKKDDIIRYNLAFKYYFN